MTFSILKWYNYCLHKALGSDPEPEPEPEPEENMTEDEQEETESREKSGDESEDRRIEFDPPLQSEETTSEQRDKEDDDDEEEEESEERRVQVDLRDRLAVVDDEDAIKQHRSSASTLNDLTTSSNQLTSDIELGEVLPVDPISSHPLLSSSSLPMPSSPEVKLRRSHLHIRLPCSPTTC